MYCPASGGESDSADAIERDARLQAGVLVSYDGRSYPIVDGTTPFVAK
jgi:hypothetical protein